MKYIMIILIIMVSIASVFAADLSDYPDFFIDDGSFNAIIVVGDKASSSDVLAQSEIGVSLVQNLNIPIKGVNKLASEIADINRSIISIGNPCVNKITSEILGNPTPCDKNFPSNKANIQLIEKDDFIYLIVAGGSDEGTRKIADILANYKKYELEGKKYEIDVESTADDQDNNDNEQDDKENEATIDEKESTVPNSNEEKNKIIESLNKKIEENKEKAENKTKEAQTNCNGCIIDGECLSNSERKNENFCNYGEIIKQKADKESCSENYECTANKCTDGKCGFKKEGSISKLLNWIRKLFGR